jgi:regulator of RNase E activity RraA
VAVYPGDVIHGDGNNITVIPAEMAEDILEACELQEDMEQYAAARIRAGEPLWGVFPANEQTRLDYARWVAAGRPPVQAVQGGAE